MTLEKPKREYHQATKGARGVCSFVNDNFTVLREGRKGATALPFRNLRALTPDVGGFSIFLRSFENPEAWPVAFEIPLEFLQ